jgi:hypothetical protein
MRYNSVATYALSDPEAHWTEPERAAIIEHVTADGEETREYTLRIRLTPAERNELQTLATAAGQTLSEYARRRVFGE